jgi:pimeloyl-ACP methyl ester carboxylesterase
MGFSLGGWVAADLAVRNASRLATLTLVDAAGLYLRGVPQIDIFTRAEEQGLRDLFFDQKRADEFVGHILSPESEDVRLNNQLAVARLAWQPRWHDPQLAKWLHRIRIPTLIVWGEEDRLFPVDYAHAFQRLIPGAASVIIPQCGHLPQLERTEAFVAAVATFLAKESVAA